MVRNLRLLLPRPVRELPLDLAGALGLVVLAWVGIFVPVVQETVWRVVVGAAFVLFAPGYAVIAALFPESGESRSAQSDVRRDTVLPRFEAGLNLTERITAAVASSVLVVPLVGLALNFSPFEIEPTTMSLSIGAFTIGALVVAAVRREAVPPEDRFRLPVDDWRETTARWRETARSALLGTETTVERGLNAILLLSVVIAAGSAAYAVAGPEADQSFTEFYLLHENETGALVADDFPTTFREGEARPLVVGVDNHENGPTDYSVVVQLQRVTTRNGSADVATTRRLDRLEIHAAANETVHRRYEVRPTLTGTALRLQFLLYVDGVPGNPTASNAYRRAHIWINVTAT